jgi:hypothetical protein
MSKYLYYFMAGARFPEPGHEMDAFLFVDRDAMLREKAVYELSDGKEPALHSEGVAQALRGMKLRATFNATMSPVLLVESDVLMTKEEVAAFVEATPWEELIKMKPRHETP